MHQKFIEGTISLDDVGNNKEEGLPNITGSVIGSGFGGSSTGPNESALTISKSAYSNGGGMGNENWWKQNINLNISRNNAIYGKSETVQPPAVVMMYIIKT